MTGYTAFADKVELARHAAALWLERLANRDPAKTFTVELSCGSDPRNKKQLEVEKKKGNYKS